MSRVNSRADHLMDLVASDSEDSHFVTQPIQFKTRPATALGSRAAGRPAKNKVTKPVTKKSTRRLSDRIAAAVDKADGRTALAEMTVNAHAAKQPKTAKDNCVDETAKKSEESLTTQKRARGRPKRTAEDKTREVPDSTRKGHLQRSAATKSKASMTDRERPETQQVDCMVEEQDNDSSSGEAAEKIAGDSSMLENHVREPASTFRAALPVPVAPNRTEAMSPDRGDPALRRRLGDMTKKYESVEMRYRDLREIAVRDAEQNFDRLKKTTDQRAAVANELVASLKSELAEQRSLGQLAETRRQQLEESETKAREMQARLHDLERALSESRTEVKTVKAKLAASRSGESAGAKCSGGLVADNSVASSQIAQMKEDLYGDLTGLIIRGIKKEGNDEIFDCIQTGRNGTLHFKLSIGNDITSSDFDDVQFMYMPQLDTNRDEALMEILPDYLVEEITFPRPHAGKFYSRVMRALTERLD